MCLMQNIMYVEGLKHPSAQPALAHMSTQAGCFRPCGALQDPFSSQTPINNDTGTRLSGKQ
jgi:hypothetical protein